MDDFRKDDYKIFDLFKNQWALVSAGTIDNYNACTVSWGNLGTLWTRPGKEDGSVVTVYIHPGRYTLGFLKENDTFTVSFFSKECQKALAYVGSHSGRNEDKIKASGLTPVSLENGVTYKEATKTFVCRKIYQHQLAKEDIAKDVQEYYKANPRVYPVNDQGEWEPHWLFIGDILEVK